MKSRNLVFVLLLLFTSSVFAQKKAVMILIDGVPADVVERVNTPNLDQIAREGGYTRAFQGGMKDGYSQTPTISAPGYMNMITGTWANKHNVWGNGIKAPNYNYWNIFRIVKTTNPKLKTAIFSTWLDNRTKLIGEGLASAGNIKLDFSYDGFEHDTVRFPHKPDRKFISDIDSLVSSEAASYIKSNGPDLSWVYLEFTDDMGHKFGDSPQMDDAVMKADAEIGEIWESVKKREKENGEEWMVVITTDHGRNPKNGKGHGGQSDRERTTWIVTNNNNLNDCFTDKPGVVDIMPSILSFMGITPPNPVREEIDGVSFVGNSSLANPSAQLEGSKLKVSWKPLEKNGEVEVYMSTSNNFKTGGQDKYELLTKVPVADGSLSVNIDPGHDFYKILLKAPDNWANTWIKK